MSRFRLSALNPRAEWLRVLPFLLLIVLVWLWEVSTGRPSWDFQTLSYLPLHSAFEMVAVVLAAMSFGLLSIAPQRAHRIGTVVLCATLIGAAVLDFLHLLSYNGMPPLVTPSGVEKGIAFWLSGRSMLTAGLLFIAFQPAGRVLSRLERSGVLALALSVAAWISWVILYRPHWLPTTFVPGRGLTSTKVAAELVLIILLLLAGALLAARARSKGDLPKTNMAIAAVLSAVGEISFASYSSASDMLNALGHIAKIGAYVYLTRAAYQLAVRQPLASAGGVADALQATINPALICSVRGEIHWVNPALLKATGYSAEALLNQSIALLKVDEDQQIWSEMLEAMDRGKIWQGRIQMRCSDGRVYLDKRSVTPVRGPQGHISGFVMMGDDVTERDRLLKTLEEREMRLKVLLESAPDAVVVIDERGLIQQVNPVVEAMFGYGKEELLGANVATLMPAQDAAQHDGFLQRYIGTGKSAIIGRGRDVLVKRKDGTLLNAHLTIGHARLPDQDLFIGFLRDVTERIQARNELAESEARYRAMMDTALDGIWISDMQGRFLAVNDAYVRQSGYSRDELLRMRIPDVQAKSTAIGLEVLIGRILAKGYEKFESVHRDKSGKEWPVDVTITYWPFGGGQFFTFVRDLTERKAAADALRLSEERFKLAISASNDGIWDSDVQSGTFYVSPRWKEIVGYDDEHLPPSHDVFYALLHPEDALMVRVGLEQLETGTGPERIEMEFRMRHKQGHWVPVYGCGQRVRDAHGATLRVVGTIQDMTERKRANQALRESEEKLRNLFALSPLGIALCTMDGRLVEFNNAYRALTGYSAEQLLQLSYWDLTPAEYMRSEAEQLTIIAKTGRYGPYEKEYIRTDGTRVPVRFNGVRIELGGEQYVWSIVEDLTQSRHMEIERQTMLQQQMQSQKLEALGHLTGGIAHDFNNMLAGIMGLANLGLERYVSDAESKLGKYLREIVRTSERGRDLVAKMLAYVRTEEADGAPPRDLGKLVGEMCDMLRSSLPSSMSMAFHAESDLPAVRISAVDVHQIIMNLVLNARDAIDVHGHIHIRLARVRAHNEVCVSCHERIGADMVLLEVADDGVGIPPELVPKIFDPFFTTKEVGRGNGLGLASVLGLAHKAGGHVQVHSAQPRGTVMRVLLPAAMEKASLPEERAPALQFEASELVWVVEDDPAVLVFLTELLREYGFSVRAFANPRQALATLHEALQAPGRQPLPHVLITDQTMPGMSGAELVKEALAVYPGLGVILCTGYSEHIDEASAKAIGVRHFLRKPFASQDLLAALVTELESRRQRNF